MINRLPNWFRQDIPDVNIWQRLRLLSEFKVNTVCQAAKCPNLSDCFRNRRLTFMLLGNVCSRNCRFCKLGTVLNLKQNYPCVDLDEPFRIAEMVKELGLNYVVITSVSRDDLADGGASVFAKTIELIHCLKKEIKAEALIPDFSGDVTCLKKIIDAGPAVIAHNLETVKRLYPEVRPKANYSLSLELLRKIKELNSSLITKSSLILGMGEKETEVIATLQDLSAVNCDILTLGQYLAPSKEHYPVKEFINPEQFIRYRQIGLDLGFKGVFSGPKVRSSYCAQEMYDGLISV
jgi:lipoic acid synthetase